MRIERQDTTSTGSAVLVTIPLRDNERLTRVELVELDSSGNQVYDIGVIALAHSGGVGIDLKVGHVGIGGSLRWSGDIPVQQPFVLVCQFFNPASGNVCSVRTRFHEFGEPICNDNESVNVLQTYPVGKPRIISLDGAATVTPLDLRPAVNTQWLVQVAEGWHDDNGGSRVASWDFYDGTNTVTPNSGGISTAQLVYIPIGSSVSTGGAWQIDGFLARQPLLLTRDVYARFNVAALGAGKKIYIRALVLEFSGGT